MKSIIDLQRALLSDDSEAVSTFFDETNRKTANQAMLAASEALGFKTGILDGWRVTTGAEITRLMGHTNDSTVRKMRSSFNLMTFSGGCSLPEFTNVREIFGLNPKDNRTVFVGWDTLLVCGMKGRTPEAERIQLYLIDCERALRMITDKELIASKKLAWAEVRDFAKSMEILRTSPDDELTALFREKMEAAIGRKLPASGQAKLNLVPK